MTLLEADFTVGGPVFCSPEPSRKLPEAVLELPRGFRLLTFECRGHGETCPMGSDEKISVEQFTASFVAQIPMGSLQEPEDVANLVLFLASDEARYVTGQAIACDGGFVLAH